MGPSSRVHRRGPAVARPSSRACRRDRGALSSVVRRVADTSRITITTGHRGG